MANRHTHCFAGRGCDRLQRSGLCSCGKCSQLSVLGCSMYVSDCRSTPMSCLFAGCLPSCYSIWHWLCGGWTCSSCPGCPVRCKSLTSTVCSASLGSRSHLQTFYVFCPKVDMEYLLFAAANHQYWLDPGRWHCCHIRYSCDCYQQAA